MTWRARAEEGARPTATEPSMAPGATSVRTTETQEGGGGLLGDAAYFQIKTAVFSFVRADSGSLGTQSDT